MLYALVRGRQRTRVIRVRGIGSIHERPRVETVDVSGRVSRVLASVELARCVIEDVSHDGGDALVLPAFVDEAFGAGVEGDSLGGIVRVELHDSVDGGGRVAEAYLREEEVVELLVGVDASGGVVGAFVGVGAVEMGDMCESTFAEENAGVVGNDVAVDGWVEAWAWDGGGVHERVEGCVRDGSKTAKRVDGVTAVYF